MSKLSDLKKVLSLVSVERITEFKLIDMPTTLYEWNITLDCEGRQEPFTHETREQINPQLSAILTDLRLDLEALLGYTKGTGEYDDNYPHWRRTYLGAYGDDLNARKWATPARFQRLLNNRRKLISLLGTHFTLLEKGTIDL